jgi:hypothetical protein
MCPRSDEVLILRWTRQICSARFSLRVKPDPELREGAEERLLCATMQFVDFTPVVQESTSISEALQLLTAFNIAFIR